ncbi:MAG: TMEM165/GDT1 family protein [Gammaproteobacteria bacterium]|nr:TMEM165/GDT1 family protein [Gammaproteobacteria bacterium]MDX2487612.1 TMEM165/GDT1 family protein [Gammaproteobacteria bacterium]
MPLPESISVFLSSFSLTALAEIGDKSQLFCMTLAARHRHWSVIPGGSNSINHTQCAGSRIRCGSRGLSSRKK